MKIVLINQSHKFLFSLCLTALAGCSADWDEPAVTVSGEVLLNGTPFTGAAVRFYNPKLGGGAFNLNESGQFESGSPLPVGEYMVSLDRPGPTTGETPAEMSWPEDKTKELPQEYLFGTRSGLVAQVSELGENHFVFNLHGTAKAQKNSREGPEVIPPLSQGPG